jgi:hypothetical protein
MVPGIECSFGLLEVVKSKQNLLWRQGQILHPPPLHYATPQQRGLAEQPACPMQSVL